MSDYLLKRASKSDSDCTPRAEVASLALLILAMGGVATSAGRCSGDKLWCADDA